MLGKCFADQNAFDNICSFKARSKVGSFVLYSKHEEIPVASFNRVILLGNLTRDVELRHTPSGTAVTEVGLAVNDRRTNQAGEIIEETTFVDITLWARTAEVANEYLSKGSPVLVEGRLKLDTWETDGQKRSKLRVIGEKMQMVGTRRRQFDESENSRPVSPGGEQAAQAEGATRDPGDEDVPF